MTWQLASIEYRMTHEQLLRRLWGQNNLGGPAPVPAIVKRLHRKLGAAADNPTYIFTKRRAGYWMERAEEPEREEPLEPA